MRLQERYVEFNVAALKEAVSKHTGRGKVTQLVKLAEGGFNRVFLLTLDNDFSVIVKIPFKISIPKKYATASEVATLEFLRLKGIPVPKVYGWSATADNEVGTEYIVMERASGNGLDTDSKWFELTKKERLTLVTDVVNIEKKLFDIPFGAIGSLYFKKDLPKEMQADLYAPGISDVDGDSETFCIGPILDYMFWYGKRAEMELDRGPCKFSFGLILYPALIGIEGRDPLKYLQAISRRELRWIKEFGKPLERKFPYNSEFSRYVAPDSHSALLEKFSAITPYLLPSNPQDLRNRPTLRHPGKSRIRYTIIHITEMLAMQQILLLKTYLFHLTPQELHV